MPRLKKKWLYIATGGNYQTFVIPLDTFMSKVDTDKYPDCKEAFRMTYQPDYKTSEEEFKQKSRFR